MFQPNCEFYAVPLPPPPRDAGNEVLTCDRVFQYETLLNYIDDHDLMTTYARDKYRECDSHAYARESRGS